MSTDRITPEDWEKLLPALKTCSVLTLEIARSVLVEGLRPADVARDQGKSRQAVAASVKRVKDMIKPFEVEELVPVSVWLPPDLAEQVLAMAKPYMK